MNRKIPFKIIPFQDAHKKDVIDLIVNIQQNEFGPPITASDQPDLTNIRKFYQEKSGNFWVAEYKNQIIGTIALLDIGNHVAALRKMFVNETYRGQKYKIAPMLLETLFDWAKSVELKEIYLGTTSKFIAAHRFYEKNDFKEITKKYLPTAFPIMSVDTKFYKYEI